MAAAYRFAYIFCLLFRFSFFLNLTSKNCSIFPKSLQIVENFPYLPSLLSLYSQQIDQNVPEGMPCKVNMHGNPQTIQNAIQIVTEIMSNGVSRIQNMPSLVRRTADTHFHLMLTFAYSPLVLHILPSSLSSSSRSSSLLVLLSTSPSSFQFSAAHVNTQHYHTQTWVVADAFFSSRSWPL